MAGVIKPEESHIRKASNFDLFPSIDDAPDVLSEAKFLFVYGYVSFIDVFDREHKEPFRFLWRRLQANVGPVAIDTGYWCRMPTIEPRTKKHQNPN